MPRARYGDLLIQSLAPLSSCGELPYFCSFLSTRIEKGGLGQTPGRESWLGFSAGRPGSLCAVAVCLAPAYAKGMEVVAPPASQKPAGSKMEGEAEGMFGHRADSGVPAGRPELWAVWHTELLIPFQTQLPGQHCGLLCASMRSKAWGPRCPCAAAQVASQKRQ